MTREEEIKKVHSNGTHVMILGAGASIASSLRDNEKTGKSLPAMNNIVQVIGLEKFVDKLPDDIKKYKDNFEKLYSKLIARTEFNGIREQIETSIYNYFKSLELTDSPTIYDYLIFSLRPKDVIATFNWDPFLYQAYVRVGQYTESPGILFLHGNVAIGYSELDKRAGPAGYKSKATGGLFKPSKILYPVENKDYNSDTYIKGQWEALSEELKIAERVTIFGYRAPDSDIEAMDLLQRAWGVPDERDMEQFELIDIREEKEVKKSWEGFIHSHHYNYSTSFFESSISRHPRRTIESYRHWSRPMNTTDVFQDGNKVPEDFKTLDEMFEWFEPLIYAEEESKKNKNGS